MRLFKRPAKACRSEGTPGASVPKLLNLFYGLVISTGFGASLREQYAAGHHPDPGVILVIGLTFLIALCDWVIFHFMVAPWAHQGLIRLFLDLVFPILLFVLSLMLDDLELLMWWLTGYFALSVAYAGLARWERLPVPGRNILWGAIAVVVCLITALVLPSHSDPQGLGMWSLLVVAGLWTVPWALWLRGELRKVGQDAGASRQ